ncbi:hypothetical protein [Heliorestis convoluta]|uniref:DUF2680 domain-containing protein n=1 Tax=Heliorestis convoluta TaxID=356322 RepID=A0A5Q2MVQ2_9FIRM|nr:hypothetical protein [Heliorestis convoluta]QGG46258.1 hypothetical protein FTV88_0079 [Heliorestis convoluta]
MKGKKKILALTLGFGLALGMVGTASAATPEQVEAIANHHTIRVQQNTERLQALVDAGRITSEQMSAALSKMAQNYVAKEATGFVDCKGLQVDGTFVAPERGTNGGTGKQQGLREVTGGLGNGSGFGAKNGQGQGFAGGMGQSQGLKQGAAWSR